MIVGAKVVVVTHETSEGTDAYVFGDGAETATSKAREKVRSLILTSLALDSCELGEGTSRTIIRLLGAGNVDEAHTIWQTAMHEEVDYESGTAESIYINVQEVM